MTAHGSFRRLLPTVLIITTMAAACGDDGGPAIGPGSVVGRTFLSESVTRDDEPRPLVEGTRIRLMLHEDGRITASAGCNTLSGSMEVERDRIVVGELSTTEMGCEPALHDQDEWLADVLVADPAYVLDGDRLRLSHPPCGYAPVIEDPAGPGESDGRGDNPYAGPNAGLLGGPANPSS